VSLCFDFYPGAAKAADKLTNLRWELTQTTTTTSYTYDQADLSDAAEIKALKAVAEHLGAPPNTTSHEWIQALMIFYNKKAGELLEKHPGAILRRHSEAKSERVAAILGLAGVPQSLAFEAAEYCLTSDTNTFHFGLAAEKYAYATSPLRRYADLVNQRCIKSILLDTPTTPLTEQEVVGELNRREKQAKAFSRDYFFMTRLAHSNSEKIYGTVISSTGLKTRVWVSHWNRTITVKHLESKTLKPGSVVAIEWYDAKEKPRWKERIVFRLEEKQTL